MSETKKCNCPGDLNQQKIQKIDNVIDLYKDRKGSLIQVLHLSQQIYGYLPLELMQHIAERMRMPLSEVTGVVSFYSFFSTEPRGEHTIRVCMGTACYVLGAKRLVEYLLEKLNVELGGVTEDGKFTLEVARCIGACGLAPAVMIDDKVYKQVSVNELDDILAEY